MYVPLPVSGTSTSAAIRGKSTAPASKTHGHRQNLHVSATQTPQVGHRANGAIHRARNPTKSANRKPACTPATQRTTTHNIPQANATITFMRAGSPGCDGCPR